VILNLDQAGWHMAKDLNVLANLTLHHLPPYSPELNAIERLWLWMKGYELSSHIYEIKTYLWQATT
jgi:transposase